MLQAAMQKEPELQSCYGDVHWLLGPEQKWPRLLATCLPALLENMLCDPLHSWHSSHIEALELASSPMDWTRLRGR